MITPLVYPHPVSKLTTPESQPGSIPAKLPTGSEAPVRTTVTKPTLGTSLRERWAPYFLAGLGLTGTLAAAPIGYHYRQALIAALGKTATRLSAMFPLPSLPARTPPAPPAKKLVHAMTSAWLTSQTLAKAGISALFLGGGIFGGMTLLEKRAATQRHLILLRKSLQSRRLRKEIQNRIEARQKQTALLNTFNIPYPLDIKSHLNHRNMSGLNAIEAAGYLKHAPVVALGDLHGSYAKLVETLLLSDMITMPPEIATRLKNIMNDPRNFSDDMNELNALYDELKAVIPHIEWKGNRTLLLIGDVLSDRGPCDLFTLKIIEHLTQDGHDDRFIRIASNHDHNVLPNLIHNMNTLNPADSINRARSLAEHHGSDAEADLKQMLRHYLSQSKLMHYNPETQTLYTHAPITNRNLEELIVLMRTKGHSVPDLSTINTPADIRRLAEQANQFYHGYVIDCIDNQRLDTQVEKTLRENGFLWNRSSLNDENDLPLKSKGVIRLVHGHDQDSKNSPFRMRDPSRTSTAPSYDVVNLDQNIRKYDNPETQAAFLESHLNQNLFNNTAPNPLYAEF